MELFKEKVWVIMSKDRQHIAKGTPRNRYLIKLDDKKDKKRFLTYSSKGKAESAYSGGLGFYGQGYGDNEIKVEPVEVEMILTTI